MECIAKLGENEHDFIFDLKVRPSLFGPHPYIVAATSESIDFWEWETWKHIQKIEELHTFNCCELINDRLFVGDIDGRVQMFKHSEK
ncbi:MAG: hypothetical protein JSV04_02235 [Candidatus Heimdallarchaeota archaeon]|nr:MAG: hypothetical protein JSV04_02235 [Candidatus Heimdallarchaeota archaeon]